MKKYEVMYILKPTLEQEQNKKVVELFQNLFTKLGSNVLEVKEIGLKDLAYDIQHFQKGYYVWMSVEANNESVAEFNRVVRINENVIRHIIVKDGE